MLKIAGCAGHGINTPGKRTPDDEREWSFNNKVILAFEKELESYEGVEFLRTDDRTGKTDVPLRERTDKANAWGADLYLSYHHNANTGVWGTWTGTETLVQPGCSAKSREYANIIHAVQLGVYGLRDRGVKEQNLHITRETHCPAVLMEGGYMDSVIDIKKLRDNSVLENSGKSIADAIAKHHNLKKKAVKPVAVKPVTKPAAKPSVSGKVTHKVVDGDTLYAISMKYGVGVEMIKKINGMKTNDIFPGDVLVIKEAPKYPGLLKEGSKGEDVKLVQKVVGVPADGDFGPKTTAAVKKFQKAHKLDADGLVGPSTWNAMF